MTFDLLSLTGLTILFRNKKIKQKPTANKLMYSTLFEFDLFKHTLRSSSKNYIYLILSQCLKFVWIFV